MKGPRAFGFRFLLCLVLAAFFVSDAWAQTDGGSSSQGGSQGGGLGGGPGGGLGGGRRGQGGGSGRKREPLPDESASPRASGPEERDAVELYSRLCVSTRGNRAQAVGIVGEGDSAIEKLTEPMLRGLESGQSGGIGWIIRMPLGDRIIVDFTPDGTCIVRAPRINPHEIEGVFQDLLDQYAASGQFNVHHGGEQTKTFDDPGKPANGSGANASSGDERHRAADKLKVHFIYYTMTLPDTGRTVELGIATTDSRSAQIQGTLTYATRPQNAGLNAGIGGR
jgi:hypothetical protein